MATFGAVEKVKVIDMLGLLERELVKATFLAGEVKDEYFTALSLAVEHKRRDTVMMMADHDSYIAGAKSEIVCDLLDKMLEMLNSYRKEIDGGEKNVSDG